MEARQRLRWQAYLDTLTEEDHAAALKIATDLQQKFPSEDFNAMLTSDAFLKLLKAYEGFVKKSSTNQTFTFWIIYIEMVEDLLLFIRATREGNWTLHLSTVQSMLPWFFACDKVNYARYLTAYWVEMSNLEDTHLTAHQQLLSGDFVAQRHQQHGFAGTACDQVIEQTANRDSKTKGGISGFSLNKGAVHRWTLTQHERAAITHECKAMAGQCPVSHLHSELDSARTQRDHADVMNITATVQNMANPFDPSLDGESLHQISSGQQAPDSVARDLLGAKERGMKALTEFCETRIATSKTSFVDFRKSQPSHTPLGFLGVQITDTLTWSHHAKALVKRAQQRMHFLRRMKRAHLPPPILTTFYRGTIESILTSCIPVWSGACSASDWKSLQRVVTEDSGENHRDLSSSHPGYCKETLPDQGS